VPLSTASRNPGDRRLRVRQKWEHDWLSSILRAANASHSARQVDRTWRWMRPRLRSVRQGLRVMRPKAPAADTSNSHGKVGNRLPRQHKPGSIVLRRASIQRRLPALLRLRPKTRHSAHREPFRLSPSSPAPDEGDPSADRRGHVPHRLAPARALSWRVRQPSALQACGITDRRRLANSGDRFRIPTRGK